MSSEQDLISSFTPIKTDWLKEGVIGMYHEGVVKAKVKVLSRKIESGYVVFELQTLSNESPFPLPPNFEVSKKFGYDGWAGWCILPLNERN